MSNYFLTRWLPNIACGLVFGAGGCLLSWWIGFRQSRIAQRTQANLLHLAAKEHGHTVNVDERGESLGTLDTRIEVPTGELTMKPPG
jgi:di/tricarboxylate transporter